MKIKKLPVGLSVISALSLSINEVVAQTDKVGFELEEVVVTARKREETLFEVPVSVSVLGTDFFERSGFNSMDDIVKFVPGFDYSPTNTTRAQGTKVRGISTFSFSDGFESSVSTVIDGVVMGREAQGFFDLYDVESVEIIKGPQGTLFGKNASAGVVNVITKKPEFEFSAGGDLTYGTFNEVRVRGTVTGPLIDDKLAYRITGSSHEYDGKLENRLPGESDVNDKDTWSARAKFLLQASDSLSALLTLDTVKENNACCQPTYRVAGDPNVVFDLAVNPGVQQLTDALVSAGITPGVGNRDVAVFDDRINQKSESSGAALELNFDFASATLTSITAWRDWKIDEFNEADGLSFSNVNNRNGTVSDSEQRSQEFRLFGSLSDSISYVTGLYYFHQDLSADGTVFIELALPFPPFFNVATNAVRTVETTSYAAFGEFTFDMTDKLSLIVGGRFTDEEIDATYDRLSRPIIETLPFAPFLGVDLSGRQREEDTDFSGRVIGRYTLNETLSTYLSWSRGYKGTGIDVAETVNIVAVTDPGGLPVLPPEVPTLIELGIKGRYLNGALSFNAAIFHQNIEDLQAISTDSAGRTLNLSIDEVVSDGVEVDVTYVPSAVDGLRLIGSLAYLDVVYEAFSARPDLEGRPYSDVPQWAASLVADYSFALGKSGYSGFARAEYSWQDDKNTSLGGVSQNDVDSYGLLNLRLGLTSPSGRYSAALSVENATDEDYPYGVFGSPFSTIDNTTTVQYQGDPRIYRLTLGVEF